ncbi:MAG TPA: N-acetylneuraminate synthase, partial [Anaerolineaceae bacterium]|nr:N-acetylneuraminate synthase [Anaerolineaceae bacterium]
MRNTIKLGERIIGDDQPVYIVGEIGINHNGDLEVAKSLMLAAKKAGIDAVKFQKRTPEICVPLPQQSQMRDTPWGYISYLDYRYKVEFDEAAYTEIDRYAKELGLDWFASSWDIPSLEFMEKFNPVTHKIASALLTDKELLRAHRATGKPIIVSTGMSTMEQIKEAVEILGEDNLVLCHTTSSYPCPPEELNLRMIQ